MEKVINILLEFLEVIIHMIIFTRRLYPEQIFEKRRKYGIVVLQSMHPLLNEYITECLAASKALLIKRELRQVIVVFIDDNHKPQNRYVVDLLNINYEADDDPFYVQLEKSFRACCLSLLTAESLLKPLAAKSRFVIQLLTSEVGSSCLEGNKKYQHFPWYPVEESAIESDFQIVPLKTIECERLIVQMYVESRKSIATK